MSDNKLFRFHRGSLEDSMKTVVKFDTYDELVKIIEAGQRPEWGPIGKITVENYGGFDDRIGWDTHLVCLDGCASMAVPSV